MNTQEKILEALNNEELIKQIALEFKEKHELYEKQLNEITKDNQYILWLEHFTINNPRFSDNDWIYSKGEINEKDNDNVNKLNILYDVIADYAQKNHLYPKLCRFGHYYTIKYNNVSYEIGLLSGQGTLFYCNRINTQKTHLDFNDIIQNKKQNNNDDIDNHLKRLENLIIEIADKNTPLESISSTTKNTIQKILKKRK